MTLTQPLLENSWWGMALTGVRGETVRPREVHVPTAWVTARPVLSLGRVGALPRRSRRVSAASRVPSGASPHESHIRRWLRLRLRRRILTRELPERLRNPHVSRVGHACAGRPASVQGERERKTATPYSPQGYLSSIGPRLSTSAARVLLLAIGSASNAAEGHT